jgi:hypothetical protein
MAKIWNLSETAKEKARKIFSYSLNSPNSPYIRKT